MYRLGVSHIDNSNAINADAYLRNSFFNPATPSIIQLSSGSDDVEGSIYDPGYYSSLLGGVRDGTYQYGVCYAMSSIILNSHFPPLTHIEICTRTHELHRENVRTCKVTYYVT